MPKNLCVRKAPGYDPADATAAERACRRESGSTACYFGIFNNFRRELSREKCLLIYFGKEYIITLHNLKHRFKEEKDDKYS